MPRDMRDAVFEEILALARLDRSVMLLTADLGAFGLIKFRRELPDRVINMGVAEQNMINVAAGLALGGKKVFVYSIIPFVTLRCLESIKVNLADMELGVCIVGGGAGFTYGGDGPTHHALEDVAVMTALGRVELHTPGDLTSARQAVRSAYGQGGGPSYIRLENGSYDDLYATAQEAERGWKVIAPGRELCVLSYGAMTHQVLKAVGGRLGREVGLIDVCRPNQLTADGLKQCLGSAKKILTVEEHLVWGGLGTRVVELLSGEGYSIQKMGVTEFGLNGGSRQWLWEQNGLNLSGLASAIEKGLNQ